MTEIRAYVITREYDLFVTIFQVDTVRNYFSVTINDWNELNKMLSMFNVQRLAVRPQDSNWGKQDTEHVTQ